MYLIFIKILIIDMQKPIYHFVNDTNHADRLAQVTIFITKIIILSKMKVNINVLITVYYDKFSIGTAR